jgi:hypothetical protein
MGDRNVNMMLKRRVDKECVNLCYSMEALSDH